MNLFVTIVLDGVGIGEAPDADEYGDEGSDTLGHVCAQESPDLPNLQRAGLGNIRPLNNLLPATTPEARYGKMQEQSSGKDSTSGHWELAGHIVEEPFPTYPKGFPPEVVDEFLELTGYTKILGNRPESGTVIIEQHGAEHLSSGQPIVYTSADSVLQIAAHVDVISLERLYELCAITRQHVCTGEHAVGRVIARPFMGTVGAFRRLSEARKDFSLPPPSQNLLSVLQQAAVKTVSVGKVSDLFAGVGFDEAIKTSSNKEGITKTVAAIEKSIHDGADTFIWINLVDFDQEFGHRNNPAGFARALEEFDTALPRIRVALPAGSRLMLTADHGNDPTTPGTDHSREFVPVLYFNSTEFWGDEDNQTASDAGNLGIRASFCDHAATVAEYFGVPFAGPGVSFL